MFGNGFRLRRACLLLLGLVTLALSAPASAAGPRVTLPANLSAIFDLRLAAADGEPSWTDGGFGRARFGGDNAELEAEAAVAEAALIWRPPIGWNLSGSIVIAAQHEQDQPVDLVEAFLSWRPVPRSATRISGRAGLFWPQVSLEHGGAGWSVADMITPSAINSWIGEEVKVIGVEGSAERDFGGNRISATIGLFGFNDTAGTLLAFRGWALHDQKTTAFSYQPLPTLNPFMQRVQAAETKPTIELDNRPGFYGRLSWRLAAPVSLDAFYYDNRGDPAAVTDALQWGWRTRFLNLGARIDFSDRTRLFAQALTGTTDMGPEAGSTCWVETRFRAAYLRLTHEIGRLALSGRLDLFDTRELGMRMGPEENEDGWALTAALRWRLSDRALFIVEAFHVRSDRGARARNSIAPMQSQTVIQSGLRLTL